MTRFHHAAAFCSLLLAALLLAPPARAQSSGGAPDSVASSASAPPSVVLQDTSAEDASAPADLATEDGRTPRGALWRAAALPGWGQFYNKQYYKIPVVYAGLGGILAFALYTNDRFFLYRNAFRFERGQVFVANGDITQQEFEERFRRYEDDRDQLADFIERFGVNALKNQRQTFRRYRDLSFIGLGIFYALTLVDAYVSAHLRSFDVGEDLSASTAPVPGGASLTLRVRF